ncbi:hypothetical protein, partial [Butyribacter sp.]|uniref:hypothetical protein n=1 Tax=Butyribacter sp. TaxID=2822465 RepID=UPI002A957727|nr:FtsX-like permease family protein [Butyribacter sp.]
MTWKYAMRECKMHIVMSVLCFVQAVFLFAIVIGMISIFMSRYSGYQPVQKLVEQKGFICNMTGSQHIADGDLEGKMVENSEAYEKMLKNAKVCGQYSVNAFVGEENEEIEEKRKEGSYFQNLRAYDDELIKGFEPKLQSGNWLKQENKNGSQLEAVVLQSSDKYKTGDMVYLDNNSVTKLKTKIPVKIVGIIDRNSDIIYQSANNRSFIDYRILFSNMVAESEDLKKISYVDGINNFLPETFFVSKKNLDSVQEHYAAKESEKNLSDNYENVLKTKKEIFMTSMEGIVFITMDKNCSDAVYGYNKNRIAQISQFSFLHELDYIKNNTWQNIMANISELIPAGIGMIIFTVISFVTLSTLMYQKNMRKYSVYYMYGLTWHNIFKIHITYIFMIIFVALIFGIVVIYAVHFMGIWNMTNVN